jgi:DNA polymerase-3 subunit gamma/tau
MGAGARGGLLEAGLAGSRRAGGARRRGGEAGRGGGGGGGRGLGPGAPGHRAPAPGLAASLATTLRRGPGGGRTSRTHLCNGAPALTCAVNARSMHTHASHEPQAARSARLPATRGVRQRREPAARPPPAPRPAAPLACPPAAGRVRGATAARAGRGGGAGRGARRSAERALPPRAPGAAGGAAPARGRRPGGGGGGPAAAAGGARRSRVPPNPRPGARARPLPCPRRKEKPTPVAARVPGRQDGVAEAAEEAGRLCA